MKKKSFLSILTSDNYILGLIVLYYSLLKTKTKYPFLVLLTPNISSKTLSILNTHSIQYKILETEILNPTNVNKAHRWFRTYSKINIFNQIQFDKIVYLDVDMLVLKNIDSLFDKPHLSATIDGDPLIKNNSNKKRINSGLLVFEPSRELFNDMSNKIGKIENLTYTGTFDRPKSGSDQDFLNAYYPEWGEKKDLHLDPRYNIFFYQLDQYKKCFPKKCSTHYWPFIIHYASFKKPWDFIESKESISPFIYVNNNLESRAIKLWIDFLKELKI